MTEKTPYIALWCFLMPPFRFMQHINPAGHGAIMAAQPAWRWSSAVTGTLI
ncbi:hypothetical protein LOD44_01005 [Xylella fastidiosa subsp. multiplex]|uniref:hypothetical protein n=1 Tax=Xylella fastidiosa TaxID=2371 RepID=UPI00004597CC|nr:hypothetical protein [Xylella fastidiosa]KAJ4853347.1 hypothetical protein XYFPCFBP8418_003625 [Xylella fastidiosa subsp. multiplex]MBE0275990.1 hypothetical protein [Xylella fastidiosa subsp. multiplex]MBE0277170.1 hypothetical protein [Xylella fastidiosa subsp. multiplex]MBE0282650.1 hypothetical protein [Xylella fastidiosa subsp. multiplex]MDC6410419.1 hypothetical protein [Xylella fastidiosa subsp. multiplex]